MNLVSVPQAAGGNKNYIVLISTVCLWVDEAVSSGLCRLPDGKDWFLYTDE